MLSHSLHAALSVKKRFGTCLKTFQSRWRIKPWAVTPLSSGCSSTHLPVPFVTTPYFKTIWHALPGMLPKMTARKRLLQDSGHSRSVRWHFLPNESLSHSFFLSEEEISTAHRAICTGLMMLKTFIPGKVSA